MIRRSAYAALFLASLAPQAALAQPEAAAASLLQPAPAFFPLQAERPPDDAARAAGGPIDFLPLPKYGGWVRVTKWVTLAAAVGLGTAGALLHDEAEDRFRRLERRCEAAPELCWARRPDGSYQSAEIEAQYQDILDQDRKARLAFIGAEVNFGVSVLLFVVDFQKHGDPDDIPYDPDQPAGALALAVGPQELALRYYFR